MTISSLNFSDDAQSESKTIPTWMSLRFIIGLITLSVLLLTLATLLFGLENTAKFGESFALIAGLVSASALVYAVVSINLQKEELKLQRKELAAQREELKRTANAQESMLNLIAQQTEAMKTQANVAQLQVDEIRERPYRDVVNRMVSDLLEDEKDIVRCTATYQMDMERLFIVGKEGMRLSVAEVRKNVMHWEKYFQQVGYTMIPNQNSQQVWNSGWISTLKDKIPNAWKAKADERHRVAIDDVVAIANDIRDERERSETNNKWVNIIQQRYHSLVREITQHLGPR